MRDSVDDCLEYARDTEDAFMQVRRSLNSKIYSLTQCDLTVNGCDWLILAGNRERIVLQVGNG